MISAGQTGAGKIPRELFSYPPYLGARYQLCKVANPKQLTVANPCDNYLLANVQRARSKFQPMNKVQKARFKLGLKRLLWNTSVYCIAYANSMIHLTFFSGGKYKHLFRRLRKMYRSKGMQPYYYYELRCASDIFAGRAKSFNSHLKIINARLRRDKHPLMKPFRLLWSRSQKFTTWSDFLLQVTNPNCPKHMKINIRALTPSCVKSQASGRRN